MNRNGRADGICRSAIQRNIKVVGSFLCINIFGANGKDLSLNIVWCEKAGGVIDLNAVTVL